MTVDAERAQMHQPVPFLDLTAGDPELHERIAEVVGAVLARGQYILGPECEAFEREFARASGAAHTVACGSGTDAIELALRALGVGPGDEVVTQANTCAPTVAAIVRSGATPVVCDVDPQSATMDPDSLERALGPRTKVVVPVHLYGQCADLDAISAVADAHDLAIVEDCAQAHGARLDERGAGTTGVLGCFSFYPTKNLGALGDAGAVVCASPELADRMRLLRQYGAPRRDEHVTEGYNSRMDEVQAAALRVKLPLLDAGNVRRRHIAAHYDQALAGTAALPLSRLDRRLHAFHLYVVRVPDRDAFRQALDDHGIATLVHYPTPIHHHAPFRHTARPGVSLRNAEQLAAQIVSLPLHPALTDAQVQRVADAARVAAQAQ